MRGKFYIPSPVPGAMEVFKIKIYLRICMFIQKERSSEIMFASSC